MIVMLLTEHHLGLLSLKGGCTGLSESTLVKMPHFWKSHAVAQIIKRSIHMDPKHRVLKGQHFSMIKFFVT